MGALHVGHLSLIQTSKQKSEQTVCSIFVNPTQFNDPSDLIAYPRPLERDLEMLAGAGCDFAFIPTVEEIYPHGSSAPPVDYGMLTDKYEGASRPGHFNGVVQVVGRLLDIVEADMAFFGEKDFQQLAVIREMVVRQKREVKIIGCPIVRSEDGLALSSRNTRLSTNGLKVALELSQSLNRAQELALTMTPAVVKEQILARYKLLREDIDLEYFDIVESKTLAGAISWETGGFRALVAAWVEGIRLIDNCEIVPRKIELAQDQQNRAAKV